MALQTQGFALSALPRSPNVPKNIGVVDVKEIYDGVKRGLESFEMVRRAPQGMALADAEMKAKTAEAPLGTRQVLAQTEGIEQQTPLKTALLEAEASPEMLEAKRTALLARSTKPASPAESLLRFRDNLRRSIAENPSDANNIQLLADTDLLLNKMGAATPVDYSAQTQAKRDIADSSNQMRVDVATADRASRESISEKDRISREAIAASQNEAKQAIQSDKTGLEKQKRAKSAKAQLDAIETRANIIEDSLEKAIPQIGVLTAGPGVLLSSIPGTDAKNVRRLLDAVKANIGFEELNNLRAQSPTGGALGNVTEQELRFLQSVLGSMEQDQSPTQLRDNLQRILDRFKELRVDKREAFERDFGAPQTAQPSPNAQSASAAPSAPQWDDAKEKELRELEARLATPAKP